MVKSYRNKKDLIIQAIIEFFRNLNKKFQALTQIIYNLNRKNRNTIFSKLYFQF